MSALLPKADIRQRIEVSAWCQEPTLGSKIQRRTYPKLRRIFHCACVVFIRHVAAGLPEVLEVRLPAILSLITASLAFG